MRQVYVPDWLSAVLSGIAPGTRTRYLSAWRHWGEFVVGKKSPPWIWRTSPDWGASPIDYILFESAVLAISPNAIRGEISGIRFWHFLVGIPDFAVGGRGGGGRYVQVPKSIRRDSRETVRPRRHLE